MYTKLIIILAVASIGIGGYYYVKSLQEDLAVAREDIVKLDIAVESKNLQINQMETNQAIAEVITKQTNKEMAELRDKAEKMRSVFSDHDFRKLVEKKPGLMARRINAGTVRVFKDLEQASRGSQISPGQLP